MRVDWKANSKCREGNLKAKQDKAKLKKGSVSKRRVYAAKVEVEGDEARG